MRMAMQITTPMAQQVAISMPKLVTISVAMQGGRDGV